MSFSAENKIHFDNDYMAGAHPEVMQRLVETNLECSIGYGLDDYSEEARNLIRAACAAPNALVQFLVGGTQTNATVIDAVEHSGHKVLVLPTRNGKVSADDVENYLRTFYQDDTYEHMVAPGMLYITQPTELGTLYSLAELEALSACCHAHHIPFYLDGARLCYALGSPAADFTLPDIARLCDVFYIGGTKCGAMFGEAVVAPHPEMLPHFFPLVKQHGALLAKGRLQSSLRSSPIIYMNRLEKRLLHLLCDSVLPSRSGAIKSPSTRSPTSSFSPFRMPWWMLCWKWPPSSTGAPAAKPKAPSVSSPAGPPVQKMLTHCCLLFLNCLYNNHHSVAECDGIPIIPNQPKCSICPSVVTSPSYCCYCSPCRALRSRLCR